MSAPVICFGQQPCGFFPRRFLYAKFVTARKLQAELGGEIQLDGQAFAMTRRGARQFVAQGKKDLMSGGMYCYLGFRMWLRSEDWKSGIAPKNRAMFGGS